jgi:hypothetical protein
MRWTDLWEGNYGELGGQAGEWVGRSGERDINDRGPSRAEISDPEELKRNLRAERFSAGGTQPSGISIRKGPGSTPAAFSLSIAAVTPSVNGGRNATHPAEIVSHSDDDGRLTLACPISGILSAALSMWRTARRPTYSGKFRMSRRCPGPSWTLAFQLHIRRKAH